MTFRERIPTQWWACFEEVLANEEDAVTARANDSLYDMPEGSVVGRDSLALIAKADELLSASPNLEAEFVQSIRNAVRDQIMVWYFG